MPEPMSSTTSYNFYTKRSMDNCTFKYNFFIKPLVFKFKMWYYGYKPEFDSLKIKKALQMAVLS
ncbi:MAG: hypothetical protein ACI4DY_06130, partial [Monoglobaceae bacterium]